MSKYISLLLGRQELTDLEVEAVEKVYGNPRLSILKRLINYGRKPCVVVLEDDIYRFIKSKVAVDYMNSALRTTHKTPTKEESLIKKNNLEKEFDNIKKRCCMIRRHLVIQKDQD